MDLEDFSPKATYVSVNERFSDRSKKVQKKCFFPFFTRRKLAHIKKKYYLCNRNGTIVVSVENVFYTAYD